MPLKTKPSLLLALLLISAYLFLSTCGVDQQGKSAIGEDASKDSGQPVTIEGVELADEAPSDIGGQVSPDSTSTQAAVLPSEVKQAATTNQTASPALVQPSDSRVDPAPTTPALPPPTQPIPLTVVAGQTVDIEFRQTLSSHTSQPGQAFRARVTEPVRVGEKIAIPAGATIHGTVTEAEPAQKIGGRARLSLEFESVSLANGATYPIGAIFSQAGRSQNAKDGAIIGGATLGGAVLGKQVGGDTGTIIGAVAGGIGGAFAAKKTKGKPVEIPAGTVMILELTQPVTIDVLP